MTFKRDGNIISIPIRPDDHGFLGRECPIKECEGYFKITPGTGLTGENLPCHCPYCGHSASQDNFWTKEQLAYAYSIGVHEISKDVLKMLKGFERRPDPKAFVSLSIKVEGHPKPIRYYREKKLEQEVLCDGCGLRYAIYGAFGYCPDCGVHNSLQILNMNVDIIHKMILLAESADAEIACKLLENALEDAVSSFDGFGREVCKTFSAKAIDPVKAVGISFQNILAARDKVKEQFSTDFTKGLSNKELEVVVRLFQKRHVISHRMGIVDAEYISRSGDNAAIIGRKICLSKNEIEDLSAYLKSMGRELFEELKR